MNIGTLGLRVVLGPDLWYWSACAPRAGEELHLCGFSDTAQEAKAVVPSLGPGVWSTQIVESEAIDVFTCADGAVYAFGAVPRPRIATAGE